MKNLEVAGYYLKILQVCYEEKHLKNAITHMFA